MKYFVIIIALFIVLTACEKQTTWDITNKSQNLIVVDGMLTDEMKIQSIKIARPVGNLNEIPAPVSGAFLTISNGDTTVNLTETVPGTGIYQTGQAYAAVPGVSYLLDIEYNGKKYAATASMERNVNFKILRYSKASNSDLYKIDWVTDAYSNDVAAMYEIYLDWSSVAGYQNTPPEDCKKKLFFYSLPTIDVNEIFSPAFERTFFPLGTVITEKRYVITNKHAAFLRALLSETNWSGGYFDSAPANVPSNLSAGAVGFFSTCPVMTVTMTVTAH